MYLGRKRSKREMVESAHQDHRAAILEPAKVANNTLRYRLADGRTFVRLHLTDIIETAPTGAITVDTGGHNTPTTRDRLNRFLPSGLRVQTSRGVAYLNGTPFRRTITITPARGTDTDIEPDDFPSLAHAERALLPHLHADETREVLAADKRAIAKWLKAQKATLRLLRDPALLDPSDEGLPARVDADALRAGNVRFGDVLHAAYGESTFTSLFVDMVLRDIVRNGYTLTNHAARICRRFLNRNLGFAA